MRNAAEMKNLLLELLLVVVIHARAIAKLLVKA